jgi:hypothetical protein
MPKQALQLVRVALAAFLALTIATQTVAAKCVSLDFQNPNRSLDKVLKPYHKKMRECIEAEWLLVDPNCGQTIAVEFLVLSHGKIVIPKADEYAVNEDEEYDLRLLPVTALRAINYLPDLPAGQDDLVVTGEFVSLPPPRQANNKNGDGQNSDGQTRRRIKNTLLVLAALAAAGGAVVGLIALNRSMNNISSGNTNPDIEWVNYPHRRAIDGAWVQGYWRTKANGKLIDNFSTQGNTNPFNGKPGWVRMP